MAWVGRVDTLRPRSTVPVVVMRGGTSKGVFLHESDVPRRGHALDNMLLEFPDPMQIDGLGGTHSSTSKVVIVRPSSTPGIDVDYWFAQVAVDAASVDWSGNCGNLTTAVAPFAIDEGLVPAQGLLTKVRLHNCNTGVVVEALVPTGAPITTNYLKPAGGVLGETFPTGSPFDVIDTPDGRVRISIVDVTHPYASVRSTDVGIWLDRDSPQSLNADTALLERLELLGGRCTVLLGLVARPKEARRRFPATPRLMVDPPSAGDAASCDVAALGFSMSRIHQALPMMGALCLGAAAAIPGTVAAEINSSTNGELRISDPKSALDGDGGRRSRLSRPRHPFSGNNPNGSPSSIGPGVSACPQHAVCRPAGRGNRGRENMFEHYPNIFQPIQIGPLAIPNRGVFRSPRHAPRQWPSLNLRFRYSPRRCWTQRSRHSVHMQCMSFALV